MTFIPIRFVDKDKDKALFFATLRKRVDAHFKENNKSKHYNSTMVFKTIILMCSYILPFIFLGFMAHHQANIMFNQLSVIFQQLI